jgi:hypothetical protein
MKHRTLLMPPYLTMAGNSPGFYPGSPMPPPALSSRNSSRLASLTGVCPRLAGTLRRTFIAKLPRRTDNNGHFTLQHREPLYEPGPIGGPQERCQAARPLPLRPPAARPRRPPLPALPRPPERTRPPPSHPGQATAPLPRLWRPGSAPARRRPACRRRLACPLGLGCRPLHLPQLLPALPARPRRAAAESLPAPAREGPLRPLPGAPPARISLLPAAPGQAACLRPDLLPPQAQGQGSLS